jgi:hypothetical protein
MLDFGRKNREGAPIPDAEEADKEKRARLELNAGDKIITPEHSAVIEHVEIPDVAAEASQQAPAPEGNEQPIREAVHDGGNVFQELETGNLEGQDPANIMSRVLSAVNEGESKDK